MSQDENQDKLVLFTLNKKTFITLIGIAVISWIISLVFYLLPAVEHDILVSFNDLRAEGSIFSEFWYFYTKWFIYIFGFSLLALYFSSFVVERLKIYRMTMFLSVALYSLGWTLLNYVIKFAFPRQRPFNNSLYFDLIALDDPDSLSFPSGHTYLGFIMVLPMILSLILGDENFKTSVMKYVISVLFLIYAVSMGLSRIFIGVHYPSDVVFSVGLSIVFMLLLYFIIQKLLISGKLNNKNEKWYGITLVVILAVVVILSF